MVRGRQTYRLGSNKVLTQKNNDMRRVVLTVIALIATFSAFAKTELKWIDATELGIHGHTKQTDKSPYYRFDHTPYEGFSKGIIKYSKESAGLYITFKTNSPQVSASVLRARTAVRRACIWT